MLLSFMMHAAWIRARAMEARLERQRDSEWQNAETGNRQLNALRKEETESPEPRRATEP